MAYSRKRREARERSERLRWENDPHPFEIVERLDRGEIETWPEGDQNDWQDADEDWFPDEDDPGQDGIMIV